MKTNEYTEWEAVQWLLEHGCKVDGKTIKRGSYSLNCWRRIDCLTHFHGYSLVS